MGPPSGSTQASCARSGRASAARVAANVRGKKSFFMGGLVGRLGKASKGDFYATRESGLGLRRHQHGAAREKGHLIERAVAGIERALHVEPKAGPAGAGVNEFARQAVEGIGLHGTCYVEAFGADELVVHAEVEAAGAICQQWQAVQATRGVVGAQAGLVAGEVRYIEAAIAGQILVAINAFEAAGIVGKQAHDRRDAKRRAHLGAKRPDVGSGGFASHGSHVE
nr:hypothetical protein [Tanacetum cinerariifolium]